MKQRKNKCRCQREEAMLNAIVELLEVGDEVEVKEGRWIKIRFAPKA